MINTKPEMFKIFHKLLTEKAPEEYVPWYFPVVKNNKAPDGLSIAKRAPKDISGGKGNWKADWARLSYYEALRRLEDGGNVGLSARAEDPLIIIDIDEWDYINKAKPTLKVLSRKRCGIHAFYFKHPDDIILPLNIPTNYGECRSSDQYVVCAGSYCKTDNVDIEKQNIAVEMMDNIIKDPMLGVYTIFESMNPSLIRYDELPEFMRQQHEKVKENKKEVIETYRTEIKPSGEKSALYDLQIENIISYHDKKRHPHPLHDSDTGMNFSVSNGLAHCWRHLVSLNAIQYLVVQSGYMSCQDAGTGHKGGGAGGSGIVNNDGAIYHAWKEAKKIGVIPKNDPVPVRAMKYIAIKNNLITSDYQGWKLPRKVYNLVLKIIESE